MLYEVLVSPSERVIPYYFVDSNICLELGRLYYKGKCSNEKVREDLIQLIEKNRNRNGGFFTNYAVSELSFDYGLNSINIDEMKRLDFALKQIISSMGIANIKEHKGIDNKPIVERNQAYTYNSIYECKLPQIMSGSLFKIGMDKIFYMSYLYRLKIQELYQDKEVSSIDKMRNLLSFANTEINAISGIEFQLAQMLFVGAEKEVQIAKKLLKVDHKVTLKLINNTVVDIFLFRLSQKLATLPQSLMIYPNAYIGFLTSDEGLAKIFEKNKIIVSSGFGADLSEGDVQIRPSLQSEWNEFYYREALPIFEKKFKLSYMPQKLEYSKIEMNIKRLEKKLY